MARSLNRVQLIGNLTRDPELRYTPQGTAVCSFGLATNRSWTTDSGEKHEESEFHRIVSWNKLAELCSQFLVKGRKVYVEGRLSTRNWTTQDGQQRSVTEVVIDDMILLDNKMTGTPRPAEEGESAAASPAPKVVSMKPEPEEQPAEKPAPAKAQSKKKVQEEEEKEILKEISDDNVNPDDIPF